MSESFFFKHISARDTGELGVFRLARPLGWLLAALGGAAFLAAFDVRALFAALGGLMALGAIVAARITDTQ
jgi:hypothetical protein